MAQQHVQISIPHPCSENWDAMKPIDRLHRHCAACDRVLVDFTQLSDAEISDYLRHNSKPCGRYRSDQLNRTYKVTAASKTKPRHGWWLLLSSFFVAEAATAQPSTATTTITTTVNAQGQQEIRGRVIDKITGEALAGAYVGLPDGSRGTGCNKQGEFTLTLRQPVQELEVYCLGYNRKKITPGKDPMIIRLEAEAAILNEVVIESYRAPLIDAQSPDRIMGIESVTLSGIHDIVLVTKKRPLHDFFHRLRNKFRKSQGV
jgi:hypothetical protein